MIQKGTIVIEDFAEPESRAARSDDTRSIPLMESDASRVLASELDRYCRGQCEGRSVLIAGHRGSGKTTTVHGVVAMYRRAHFAKKDQTGATVARSEEEPGLGKNGRRVSCGGLNPPLYPLTVILHGPNLLPPDTIVHSSHSQAPGDANGQEPASNGSHEPETRQELRIVLEQIVMGLHQALADFAAENYQDRAKGDVQEQDVHEAAAQLRLELDVGMEVADLRRYWEAAGALDNGVFFNNPDLNQAQRNGQEEADGRRARKGQGAKELVALASVGQAFRRVVFHRKNGANGHLDKPPLPQQEERKSAIDKLDVWAPLVSILTGGAFGGGAKAAGVENIVAFVVGVVAAVVAVIVSLLLKHHLNMSRMRCETRLLVDTSAATLERVLPILVDRLKDAGVAPVFVIEELDKVDRLPRRMRQVLKDLKRFVAEGAFFCFLTDRSYLEYLLGRTTKATAGYPVEVSYFGSRALVSFGPDDFHHYFNKIMKFEETADD